MIHTPIPLLTRLLRTHTSYQGIALAMPQPVQVDAPLGAAAATESSAAKGKQ